MYSVSLSPEAAAGALTSGAPPSFQASKRPSSQTKKKGRERVLTALWGKVPAACYSPTGEPRSTLADEAMLNDNPNESFPSLRTFQYHAQKRNWSARVNGRDLYNPYGRRLLHNITGQGKRREGIPSVRPRGALRGWKM